MLRLQPGVGKYSAVVYGVGRTLLVMSYRIGQEYLLDSFPGMLVVHYNFQAYKLDQVG